MIANALLSVVSLGFLGVFAAGLEASLSGWDECKSYVSEDGTGSYTAECRGGCQSGACVTGEIELGNGTTAYDCGCGDVVPDGCTGTVYVTGASYSVSCLATSACGTSTCEPTSILSPSPSCYCK